MRRLAAALATACLVVNGAGCSVLASKEATVLCQAADTATTVKAIQAGAKEQNPLWRPIIEKLGLAGFVVGKIALTVALVAYADTLPKEGLAAVNVITCAAAVNNLRVIKAQP